jgi:uncharacterized protein
MGQKRPIQISVSDSIGHVTAEIDEPDDMKCIMTFAHGAGAGMNHPFMTSMANLLASKRIGSVRFNFPYMEQKKKRPDVPAVAHKTIETVLQFTIEQYPLTPLFVSGKSFGGRMTSQYLANLDQPVAKGLVFFGFPLHAPGKPSTDRADHLKKLTLPMLFLQGTRDTLAEVSLIKQVCKKLPSSTLVLMEGADHSFKKGKETHITLLADKIDQWLESIL